MCDKANILIVDDEEVVRRSYSRVLSGEHCRTESAVDGVEALRAMARGPFDVVFLDLRMPGPDGLTVLRTIKQIWPESEVVIVTGFPTIDNAKEALRLGAFDYLAKPVDPEQVLHAATGAVLRKRWALRPLDGTGQAARGATQALDTQSRSFTC